MIIVNAYTYLISNKKGNYLFLLKEATWTNSEPKCMILNLFVNLF